MYDISPIYFVQILKEATIRAKCLLQDLHAKSQVDSTDLLAEMLYLGCYGLVSSCLSFLCIIRPWLIVPPRPDCF